MLAFAETSSKDTGASESTSVGSTSDKALGFFGKFINLINSGKDVEAEKLASISGVKDLNKIFGKISNLTLASRDEKAAPDAQCEGEDVHKTVVGKCFVYVLKNSSFNEGGDKIYFKAHLPNSGRALFIVALNAVNGKTDEFKIEQIEGVIIKNMGPEGWFEKFLETLKDVATSGENN